LKKAEVDNIKNEYESKIKEMEQTIFEKEDHFGREIEVLKSRNKKMANELDLLKMRGKLDELNGEDIVSGNMEEKIRTIQTLESELSKCNAELEKIVSEKVESDIKASSLNESIGRLESLLKEKEDALSKHRQVEELLNESLELEKKSSELTKREKEDLEEEVDALKGSFSPKLKKATLQQKLEIECLKSELERTKLELKDAQESSIRVHEKLFEEHEEMYETLKSMPNQKRKRVLEDIYYESKKRKQEFDESDLLSESIDDAIIEDENYKVALSISEVARGKLESPVQETERCDKDTVDKITDSTEELNTLLKSNTESALHNTNEAFDEDTLLTSTPSGNKKASILFASWQTEETKNTQAPGFYREESNLDELFDSYA